MTRAAAILAIGSLVIVACASESPTGPHWEEQISHVSWVSLPDTAKVGVPFLVRIGTFGFMDESHQGRDVVTPTNYGYLITTYDWHLLGLYVSVRGYEPYEHRITLTVFNASIVRIDVQDLDYTPSGRDTLVTISKQVVFVF